MLGFRGHFVTKSRGYSTTLGELRAARAAYRAAQNESAVEPEPEADLTPVLAEASLRAGREALLDLRCRPPCDEPGW